MNAKNKKNILDLSASEAKSFLLKEESYFTLDLPLYFTFENLLSQHRPYMDFYGDENLKVEIHHHQSCG